MMAEHKRPGPVGLRAFRVTPIDYRRINETTAGLDRIEGEAFSSNGELIEWSLFRKRLCNKNDALRIGNGKFAASDDLRHWNYWLREIEAYKSGLLADMATGLRVPYIYFSEVSDDSATLYLEDIIAAPAASWSVARFLAAIRQIGRFQGRFTHYDALPSYPWLTQGHLRAWLPELRSDSPDSRVRELVKHCEPLVAEVENSPRTICHYDLRAANLFGNETGETDCETVIVDWSSVGVGALGEDIANMVFDSIWLTDCSPDLLIDLNHGAMQSYIAGLSDAGWTGDERRVYRNYAFTAALRFGLLRDGFVAAASSPEFDSTMRQRYNKSGETMLKIRTAVCDLALDQAMQELSKP